MAQLLLDDPAQQGPDETRRLRDLLNCLDSEIEQANVLLQELVKRRSTLLSESACLPREKEPVLQDIRRYEQTLDTKTAELTQAQQQLAMVEQHSTLTNQHWNDPAYSTPISTLPAGPNVYRYHNKELDQLRQRVAQLERERIGIAYHLEYLRRMVAPILRLPAELLEHIFTFCLPSQRFVPLYQQSAPLLLTSVNRMFRERALATPCLWASLSIHRNSSGSSFYPQPELIKLFIDRSVAAPLSWSLEDSKPSLNVIDEKRPPLPVSDIVELYAPHHERWKHVRIDYGSGWVPTTGLEHLPNSLRFPILETLSIKRGYWHDQREIKILRCMLASPRLWGASWYSQKPYTTLVMPWTQLRQFSVNHLIPLREAFGIIGQCSVLEEVELNLLLPRVGEKSDPGIDMLTHRTIRAFKAGFSEDPDILFDNLTLPYLKHLELANSSGIHSPLSLNSLRRLFQRSKCALEKLAFQEVQLEPDDLLELLKYLSPSITELSFQSERHNAGYVDGNILRLMTYSDRHHSNSARPIEKEEYEARGTFRGVLCPRLKTLWMWGVVYCKDEVLTDMLMSRWIGCRVCRPGDVLDSVFVVLDDDMDENRHIEDFKRLEALKAQRPGLYFQRLVRIVNNPRRVWML